jgi:hypothetical protein
MTKEEWKHIKFDRIRRVKGVVVEKLDGKTVGVYVDPSSFNHYSCQVATIVSLTILSKWCDNIVLDFPRDAKFCSELNIPYSLKDWCNQNISHYNSSCIFKCSNIKSETVDIILAITAYNQTEVNVPIIFMDGNGWAAYCGKNVCQEFIKTDDINPVGPAFSACLANAALFRELLELEKNDSFQNAFDLYSNSRIENVSNYKNPVIPSEIDFGIVHQVGCGAVGSSLDFLLSLGGFKGNFMLIDFDKVQIENLISSLVFTEDDAMRSSLKIESCSSVLADTGIKTQIFEGNYSDFIASCDYLSTYPDLVLCLANEKNVWSTIQNNYPPLVLHSTTSANWGLNVGRHFPFYDECIVCRFGIKSIGATPICGQAVVENAMREKEEKLGTLPFLSPAAAALLLAQMIKQAIGGFKAEVNFIEFSMKISSARFMETFYTRKEDCSVCSAQDRRIHSELCKKSKYFISNPFLDNSPRGQR